ncbi:Cep3p [Lachancea thermotolerans CBS 6340]|uniref:KLTH0F09702p n=1 Tax=Lachancea thermotolerans (strain ATCC 56472 / CBS 6340 / NRRL Y-8284) TaxID=559295 RepID=C5DL38_LACTC|nr:KLTH0F09702p [Lachancea thermotolerans CBS 6340]CAR24189.1 KLTH0F09702p [Lachancea thermotolerans CBS 6340]
MLPQSRPVKSKNPCSVCTKRKVKCDRLVPCSNCVKREEEERCIASYRTKLDRAGDLLSESKHEFLTTWQAYDYWVFGIGIFQNGALNKKRSVDSRSFEEEEEESSYWRDGLNMDTSFKLLDFAIENLGSLFFGCVSDVGELYFKLEEYWGRLNDTQAAPTTDSLFSSAILWSIFTMAIFYMPIELLGKYFPSEQVARLYDSTPEQALTERLRMNLFEGFYRTTVNQLKKADFLRNPVVETIQTYLILAATPFPALEPSLANSLLTQCLHLAKYWRLDQFRPLVTDTPDLRLTKVVCEKLWYRLCVQDFWQSGPNKPLSIHEDNISLLSHAAYLMDRPNVDVYQSEDTFEALIWKIVSLDRDLEKYFITTSKPPLKTIDAIQRQIDIFSQKINSTDAQASTTARCDKFLAGFLLNFVNWKLSNLNYIYYDPHTGAARLNHYTTVLIAQVLHNIKNKLDFYNRMPLVLRIITKLMTFHTLCNVYDDSATNEQLALDLSEVFAGLGEVSSSLTTPTSKLLDRVRKLKPIWRNVRVVDSESSSNHPVFKILQDDIVFLRDSCTKRLPKFLAAHSSKDRLDDGLEAEPQSREFLQIVANFEKSYPLNKILNLCD